ncbi:MAG: tetratricopeptide repeat protein [Alphaproteobacteria bacterium]|nr:tetratricopeptide repeat protein [Alphaproteobacteria bacterium]
MLLASCSQDWSSDKYTFTDKHKNLYLKGKSEMAVGHYGLAVQSFREALLRDPSSVMVLNALAASYDLLGRFDLAERYYRQALSLDPKSIQTLNNLGYSYYLRGEFQQARGLFERAARIDAKNPVVVANLASLEKADAKQQLASARQRQAEKSSKETKVDRWIERSGRKVQTLVTKPDPATVRAAREAGIEPRIMHPPQPLIEIATAPETNRGAAQSPARATTAGVAGKTANAGPKIEAVRPTETAAAPLRRVLQERNSGAPQLPGNATPADDVERSQSDETLTAAVAPGVRIEAADPSEAEGPVTAEPLDTAEVLAKVESPAGVESPIKIEAAAKVENPVKVERSENMGSPVKIEAPAEAASPVKVEVVTKTDSPVTSDSPIKIETPAESVSVAKLLQPQKAAAAPAAPKSEVRSVETVEEASPSVQISAVTVTPSTTQSAEAFALVAVPSGSAAPRQDSPAGADLALPELNQDVARDVRIAALRADGIPAEQTPPMPELSALDVAKGPEEIDTANIPELDIAKAANEVKVPEVKLPSATAPEPMTKQVRPDKIPELDVERAVAPAKVKPALETASLGTKPGSATTVRRASVTAKKSSAPEGAETEMAALKAAVRLEVSNGAGRLNMAARMGRYLVSHGLGDPQLTNAKSFTNMISVLYFRPGYIANAKSLSQLLPVSPRLKQNAEMPTHLRLVLGGDLLAFDRDLIQKSE